MVLTLGDLISYGVAAILLFIMYKKVIAPFSKKMLALNDEEDDELDYKGINFDDLDLDGVDKDALLREKMNKIKKEINLKSDIDEDKLKYDILLERLKDIALDKPQEVTDVLKSLTKDKGRE